MRKLIAIVAALAVAGVAFAEITSSDSDDGVMNRTTLNLRGESVSITYGGSGTNSVGGVKIWDFPEGVLNVHGVVVDGLGCTIVSGYGLAVTDDGDFGIGTTSIAAAADLTTATEIDLCPKTSADNICSNTAAYDAVLAADAIFDGSATAKDAYLNILIDADAIGSNAVVTVDGTVQILWSVIGDN